MLKEISSFQSLRWPLRSTCYWSLSSHGQFSTKSAYQSIESLNWDEHNSIWAKLWKLPMAQRVRTFTWLLLKGKLLTNEEWFSRSMTSDCSCPICLHYCESLDHVFKGCSLASTVWRKILPADMFHDFFTMSIQNWLALIIQSNTLDTSWKIGVCITCWKLWESCNKFIFADGVFYLR